MAGRRMRAAVGKLMASKGIEPKVVVSGLTNEYIHYITTLEEYQVSLEEDFSQSLMQPLSFYMGEPSL